MRKLLWLIFLFIFSLSGLACASSKKTVPAPKPEVTLGIERIHEYKELLAGKRLGLITNATGVDKNFKSSVAILKEQYNLVAIFTPEHGFLGQIAADVRTANSYSAEFQLPIYSLYGATRKPSKEMLDNVDVLIFDIQDVGARHYTYISTMALAMQAAKEHNKLFVVLDRPNPLGGAVQGPTLKPGNESFVGLYPLPLRHGMTVGELAQLFNKEYGIGAQLHVIPMLGWSRNMYMSDTGLPWIQTSPNIPTALTALVYPAAGMSGSSKASDGVGTTQPFEFVGMPGINAYELARTMNAKALEGVYFRPISFIPKFGKLANQECAGVQLHITDKHKFNPAKTGAILVKELEKLYTGTEFWESWGGSVKSIDAHLGEDSLRTNAEPLEAIFKRWEQESMAFQKLSRKYYLYK